MAQTKRLFAQGTTVASSKSRAAIEALVLKHGATSYASGYEGDRANVLFKMNNRRIRFTLDLKPVDGAFTNIRNDNERENMRRWRCLLHLLKGKFLAVEEGLASFEDEFLAFTLVPGGAGETVAQWIGPQLAYAYDKGVAMPPLLGPGG